MALARWQATITDGAGNIVPNAQVEVRQEIAGSPLARLYTDRQGTDRAPNPIAAGSDGYVFFHVTGGAYRITATKGTFSREWRYVGIGRNSESDLVGLRPQGNWDAEHAYDISDFVMFASLGFVSKQSDNLGNEPPPGAEDNEFWMYVPLAAAEAELAREKAQEWAEKGENVAVEPGEFSAKHHALKAASSATAAATSKTGADTAKAGAETAKAGAETAKAGAEVARDAALATGKIYPNTATGLAAVANGEYFLVPSAEDSESFILYRDVSGVATEIKRFLTEQGLRNFLTQIDDAAAEAVHGQATPARIFAAKPGIWLRPSATATLYPDTTGPATFYADEGDTIGRVVDKSGHGYHYQQATAANRPKFVRDAVNGKPALRFSGAQQLVGTKFGLTRNIGKLRMFVVIRYATKLGTQNAVYFSSSASGGGSTRASMGIVSLNGDVVAAYRVAGRRLDSETAVNGTFTVGSAPANEFIIQETFFDYANGAAYVYRNGLLAGADLTYQTAGATSDLNEKLVTIGAASGLTEPLNGDIAEVVVVAGELTPAEISGIRRYLSGEFGLPLPDGLSGAYTWFNDPRCIMVDGQLLIGSVSLGGDIIVSGEDYNPIILWADLETPPDDHDNPGFLVRASDSKILAFFCGHVKGEYYRAISTSPNDFTSWETPVNIDSQLGHNLYTYANPIQLLDETDDPIYLFLRASVSGGPQTMAFAKSTDGGETFGAATRLLSTTRAYFKVAKNGEDRIDVLCNDTHPTDSAVNSTYHFYYQGGGWFKSDGTSLGLPPWTPSSRLTRIFDGSTVAGRSWVHSLAIGSDGQPRAAFAVFPTPATDHRYRYARWDGAAWTHSEICDAGGSLYPTETFYSGGVFIDPDDVNTVYCARKVDSSGAIDNDLGVFQLFRYVTADGGATWTGEQLTFGSDDCFRPYKVAGSNKLTYVTGNYVSFTGYFTSIKTMVV